MTYTLPQNYWPNFIGGAFDHGGRGRVAIKDPSTGVVLAEHALADQMDVNRAVSEARRVHEAGSLANLHPAERGAMLRKVGQFLADNFDAVRTTITLEQGKPLFEASKEVRFAIAIFDYFGSMAQSLEGRSVPSDASRFDFTVYEPFGVSAQIMPAHYPVYILSRTLAVALAAGNSCVMKTSELAPISASWLARAIENAGFPKGSVSIFCADKETSAALASHSEIDHLVFVGTKEVAAEVLASAAKHYLPSVVETGGTSPTVFFEDGSIEAFLPEARLGIFLNAGQFCCAMYRVIVHESRYKEVVDRSVELAESLRVGPGVESDGDDFRPYMGPLQTERQLQRVLGLVNDATNHGAKCVAGGERILRDGSFMRPTVLVNVKPHLRVAQEEIFGPVMSFIKFQSEEEAIQIANGARHSGLVCNVFTQDLARMMRVARRVKAGHVIWNSTTVGGPDVPFGGFGRSGHGSLKGREALLSYAQRKNILLQA